MGLLNKAVHIQMLSSLIVLFLTSLLNIILINKQYQATQAPQTLFPFLVKKATVSMTAQLAPKPLEISALVINICLAEHQEPQGRHQVFYSHSSAGIASEIERQMCPVPSLPSDNTFHTDTERSDSPSES